jgi:hypothetical protein
VSNRSWKIVASRSGIHKRDADFARRLTAMGEGRAPVCDQWSFALCGRIVFFTPPDRLSCALADNAGKTVTERNCVETRRDFSAPG